MKRTLLTLFALLTTPALAQLQATGQTTQQAVGLTLPGEAQVVEPLGCAEYVIRWSLATDPVMSVELPPEEREPIVQEQLTYVRSEVQQGKVACVLFTSSDRQALHSSLTQRLSSQGYAQNEDEVIESGGNRYEWWETTTGGRIDAFYSLDYSAGLLAFFYRH